MNEGPDKFGIRKLSIEDEVRKIVEIEGGDAEYIRRTRFPKSISEAKPAQVATILNEPDKLSTREWIAKLIRELTYRELCQISDELRKCDASCLNESDVNMAKILDDWAHMVKDEGEERVGSDDLINMA